MSAPILSITDLSVSLPAGADRAEAVSGVSLTVNANEIVCLVGESGSGKSMIAHTILGLLPPGVAVAGGAVTLCGRDVAAATEAELRAVRGRDAAMIFQEPLSALNPLKRVGAQIAEAIRVQAPATPRAAATSRPR
ncbi:ATP-binding cassette domain-containing protein [Methylobacterium oryzae]|uniref:ATP-binding cassette domain-containing protein n=1 Tax=Methylobacterium oryzae TaxID=334852 RepID=UPI003AF7E493